MPTMTLHQAERIRAHSCPVHPEYVPEPERHLANSRDAEHYYRTRDWLGSIGACSVLDVGSFDSWLDFLLIRDGFFATGVELIPELAAAARRYAARNFLHYNVHVGFVNDMDFLPGQFDAVICYETLEHIRFLDALRAVSKFETWASKGVMISLPNQSHINNPQHCYTPSEDLIARAWPKYQVDYVAYPGTDIPGNWFLKCGFQ